MKCKLCGGSGQGKDTPEGKKNCIEIISCHVCTNTSGCAKCSACMGTGNEIEPIILN